MRAVHPTRIRSASFTLGIASRAILRIAAPAAMVAAALSSSSFSTPAFVPNPNLRGIFAGSGSDCMHDERVAREILDMVAAVRREREGNDAEEGGTAPAPRVLYLGTATYDLPCFRERQTSRLAEMGCAVSSLDVSGQSPPPPVLEREVGRADVLVVGGGNTLHAIDRWGRVGLIPVLRRAADRGCVLTGGSAGAIWAFDGGHSDSADPDTYRSPMLEKYGGGGSSPGAAAGDESSSPPDDAPPAADWEYLRVPGLNLLPGLLCPHHDMVQSNGLLRADDFDSMLLRHRGERGIGIDHWAALCVEGDRYRVLSIPGKPGSVLAVDGHAGEEKAPCPDRTGVPGIWIKEASAAGGVRRWVCPPPRARSPTSSGPPARSWRTWRRWRGAGTPTPTSHLPRP